MTYWLPPTVNGFTFNGPSQPSSGQRISWPIQTFRAPFREVRLQVEEEPGPEHHGKLEPVQIELRSGERAESRQIIPEKLEPPH